MTTQLKTTTAITPKEWRAQFVKKLRNIQIVGSPLIATLLNDPLLYHVADHVRGIVCDLRQSAMKSRKSRGLRLRLALQAELRALEHRERVESEWGLVACSERKDEIKNKLASIGEIFNIKRMGVALDSQALYALDYLLLKRLGQSSPSLLADLLACGYSVNNVDRAPSAEVIHKNLVNFRKRNRAGIVQLTEEYVDGIIASQFKISTDIVFRP